MLLVKAFLIPREMRLRLMTYIQLDRKNIIKRTLLHQNMRLSISVSFSVSLVMRQNTLDSLQQCKNECHVAVLSFLLIVLVITPMSNLQ